MGFLGNSHFGLEDLAVLRAIPNITIISPADCSEIHKTIQACVGYPEPVYIRLTGGLNAPIVYEGITLLRLVGRYGCVNKVSICLVSSGTTVGHCLAASHQLEEMNIKDSVLNMHTIKPLDIIALERAALKSASIFVIEEHFALGGLAMRLLDILMIMKA